MKEGRARRDALRVVIPSNRKDSSELITEFSTPSVSKKHTYIDLTDKIALETHLIDFWIVLRKIARTVLIFTIITLVIPGLKGGKLAISPYEPAVLLILNSIIKHSLGSLASGGDVEVFIGSPLTPITLYINLAFFIAVLISLPVTVKELTAFVRPGLTDAEYQILKQLSRYAAVLFLLGSLISFYVILPVTLKILAISGGVIGDQSLLQMYSLSSIINLLLWGTLGGGLLYASPIILVVLVNLEVLQPEQLVERRREIMMVIFIIAAFVTPDPTIVSMLILSLPLIGIVEIMISWSYKIELKKLLINS
jgi:sec-independent protein translocase protein TatC